MKEISIEEAYRSFLKKECLLCKNRDVHVNINVKFNINFGILNITFVLCESCALENNLHKDNPPLSTFSFGSIR